MHFSEVTFQQIEHFLPSAFFDFTIISSLSIFFTVDFEVIHNSEKSKTPIQIIIGEKDASSNTMAVNIFGKENMKDVDYKKAINSIKKSLKEPEFSLDG